MTTWYLIIILTNGYSSSPISQQTIEFKNELACISVMEVLAEKHDASSNTIICVKDE